MNEKELESEILKVFKAQRDFEKRKRGELPPEEPKAEISEGSASATELAGPTEDQAKELAKKIETTITNTEATKENPTTTTKIPNKKKEEPKEKIDETRRKILIGLGLTGGALALGGVGFSISKFYNWLSDWFYKKKERILYRGIKVPDFVYEPYDFERKISLPPDITELMQAARLELKKFPINHSVVQDVALKEKPEINSDVVLAILDLKDKSKTIRYLTINQYGELIKSDENTKDYVVLQGKDLGVSTRYSIAQHEDVIVLATKQAVRNPRYNFQPGEKVDASKYAQDGIYPPYDKEIYDNPEVREKGFEYLVDLMQNAKQELDELVKNNQLKFLALNSLKSDKILLMPIFLTIVEQIDAGVFANRSKKILKDYETENVSRNGKTQILTKVDAEIQAAIPLVKKALTIMGQAKEVARNFSFSSADALGLCQFTPSTYKAVREKYKGANLKEDFFVGAMDHKNIAKATWLLIDADLSVLTESKKMDENLKQSILNDPLLLASYLAASYNFGSGRTVQHIIEHPEDWTTTFPDDETNIYLEKLRPTWALFDDIEPEKPIAKLLQQDAKPDRRDRTQKINIDDIPIQLRGAADKSQEKQNNKIEEEGLERIPDGERLKERIAGIVQDDKGRDQAQLVALPELKDPKDPDNANAKKILVVNTHKQSGIGDPERRYCLPWVKKFLEDMAIACHNANPNFEPIMINSAVRTIKFQKELMGENDNASSSSSHIAGCTVDVAYSANPAGYKGMGWEQMRWIQNYLMKYEALGLIEVTQEIEQTVFHFMVFKKYQEYKPEK